MKKDDLNAHVVSPLELSIDTGIPLSTVQYQLTRKGAPDPVIVKGARVRLWRRSEALAFLNARKNKVA
jgi:hypothetical protein